MLHRNKRAKQEEGNIELETSKRKKPYYIFFMLLLLVFIYVGYCLGTLDGEKIALSNVSDKVLYALRNPLPVRRTDITMKCIFMAIGVWAIVFLTYMSNMRNYMPGREYGTARWAQPEEINKRLQNKDPAMNKILSQNLRMSIDDRATRLNNNCIIIGGSGAGKTFFYLKPNGYQMNSTYVFTDPKEELLRDMGGYLQAGGYTIVVLNLIDMDRSDGYNPFAYIRSEEDIIKLITNLIANTTPKNVTRGDPFWEKAESLYLQSLMLYVWLEYPKKGKAANFRGVLELLNMAKIPEDEDELSDLDKLMYELPPEHSALIAYNKVRRGAVDTVRSVIISANSRLAYMQNEKLLRILDKDEMNIPYLGEGVRGNTDKKTALFCVIPDNDKSYNFVIGLLYTQIFQELYYIADHKYGGRLPVPVSFKMDEFSNIALPDSFCELLSTMRSRGISCDIIIQNLAQIKALFKDTWETITGNADTMIYLGGNEQSSHKYISERLGKWTIDKKTTGESRGMHGSSSRNYDVLGRELLTPDEISRLDNKKCIVFIRGFYPVIDDKYKTDLSKEFKKAQEIGPYLHRSEDRNEMVESRERQSGEGTTDMKENELDMLTMEEVEYYRKLQREGQDVNVIDITAEQLLNLSNKEIEEMFAEKGVSAEDIAELLASEDNQQKLEESLKEDVESQKEYENLEHSDTDKSLVDNGKKPYDKLVALLSGNTDFRFEADELQEIRLGIANGISEEIIYAYATSGKGAEYMKAMRELNEALLENRQ